MRTKSFPEPKNGFLPLICSLKVALELCFRHPRCRFLVAPQKSFKEKQLMLIVFPPWNSAEQCRHILEDPSNQSVLLSFHSFHMHPLLQLFSLLTEYFFKQYVSRFENQSCKCFLCERNAVWWVALCWVYVGL